MKNIYLDYAAATPVDPEVLKTMEPYFTKRFYNPSATYLAGRDVKHDISQARQGIAGHLGAKPAEVIFTAGATEANNLALRGIMHKYPEAEVLVSSIEHESVLAPARLFKNKEIPCNNDGVILLNKLSNMISDKTVLVSVMMVNNELGTIQPIREITRILNEIRDQRRKNGKKLPLYFHTDAAQAGNYLDLHVSRLGVDMMSINGGKLYGPKQSGALFIKAGLEPWPLIVGGGQEMGLRSGTENPSAIMGLAKALELAQTKKAAETKRVADLRHLFEKNIAGRLPSSIINGSTKHRSPHIVSLTLPGEDNERLMMELDERGIQCAVGSACSASREEASHVLAAIGLLDGLAQSTLRFSLGRYTTKKNITDTVEALAGLIDSNR